MFLGKNVLNLCSKFLGEPSCRSVNSIKLQSYFIEIKHRHVCSPVILLHIFRALSPKNTIEGCSCNQSCHSFVLSSFTSLFVLISYFVSEFSFSEFSVF